MSTFHHDLMAQLDAAQESGELTFVQHRQMRETLRRANMNGAAYTSMEALRATLGTPRVAGRFAKATYN